MKEGKKQGGKDNKSNNRCNKIKQRNTNISPTSRPYHGHGSPTYRTVVPYKAVGGASNVQ